MAVLCRLESPNDGQGGKGQGESAVYGKITARLTNRDKQMLARFSEPKKDWVAPLGWLGDQGRWLSGSRLRTPDE